MPRLWVVGSLNTDLIWTTPRFVQPGETLLGTDYREIAGGKGGNQAVALARLGGRPRVVACVGDDDRGRKYLNLLQKEGAETDLINVVKSKPTGLALIEVASSGENRIVVIPGANQAVTPEIVENALADLAAEDLVLLQMEIPLSAVFQAIEICNAKGARVVLDPAPAAPLPDEVLAQIDYLTPNESEARILVGLPPQGGEGDLDAARVLATRGARTVVQKAGGRGAFLIENGRETAVPSFTVPVVDTVGAGDAFNAGFAFALSTGHPLPEAVRWGNAVGALSTRSAGAQTSLPTRAEMEALLNR